MAYNISAFAGAGAQFFDDNGDPLTGGLLYAYTAGTTTPATTWTSNSGASANTNPIVLDAAGRTPAEIWVNSGATYKFILKTSTGTLVGTYDNIPAIDDPTVFNNLITVTGTNTLIGTSVPPYTSYVAGMTLSFIPVATNTGAVTIDVDGLGAKNIYVGSSTAMIGGELVAGRIAQIEYDGVRFQLYQASISIADGSITTAKLADDAVTTIKIADSNVTTAKIADSNVTTAKIANGNVTEAKIGTGAVTVDKIGAAAVTVDKIGSAAVTAAKLDGAQTGTAPIYGARAWVNFNGTGTVAIRASGNVSSITDNGTGDYTVNFTTAMPDTDYSTVCTSQDTQTNTRFLKINSAVYSTTQVGLFCGGNGASLDPTIACVTIFR
jgi:hypothetical protein